MKVIKFAIDVASGNRDFVIEQNYVKRNSKGLDGTHLTLNENPMHAKQRQAVLNISLSKTTNA
jgi:hypothetical protein